MGTRGAIGLFKDGKGKVTYNHYDSYPQGVGKDILKEAKEFSVKDMKKAFDKIKLIKNSDKKPTKKEIEKFSKFANTSVGSQGVNNKEICTYYQLLRELQGTLKPYLSGEVTLMIDNENFLKDSLFCEWAYIINLDKEILEVWQGFQTQPQENRYKIEVKTNAGETSYFNCALVKEYNLNNLPTEKQFLKELEKLN